MLEGPGDIVKGLLVLLGGDLAIPRLGEVLDTDAVAKMVKDLGALLLVVRRRRTGPRFPKFGMTVTKFPFLVDTQPTQIWYDRYKISFFG